MFSWVGILSGVVSIINKVASYFTDKQLIDAGKAEQAQTQVAKQQATVKEAQDVENTINGLSDADVADKLRTNWTRPD